ncbi:hypothetical protein [Desulfolutivibrio sulfoxidireducens]|uniref:hypothetical protein n=1 Tax=Desulfolutivibrio sulfoxidireducens TaxID=2773299 RepID=UPI00159EA37D|nr:hypothetical protein [Desulfolutivibrio sulfoxidireducens]QLA14987.1 hypothetical protein GD605_01895 [Desulfolutivibrio sulfoxidireducens]QLA18554.1 hypothetical protein GD604_01825 [Desulfolutivibrio sulfoxidireducens]
MAPEAWLGDLSQNRLGAADRDLAALREHAHPFLSEHDLVHHVTRLSGHLTGLSEDMRRRVIAYSLYVRQLDVIQAATTRDICRDDCQRPPVGCCNANHFTILSLSDLMVSSPSPAAMQLSHVIDGLQRQETAYELRHGRTITSHHCDCLAEDGCTLRLFKSPRCVHYLCAEIQDRLLLKFGPDAAPFLAAMRRVASLTITVTADFTDAAILTSARPFFD